MGVEEQTFDEVGRGLPDTVASQMFGKRCFKIGSKAFVCFFQDAMVFKLGGEDHAEALSLDGSKLFDPSGKGRAMKEWVQVTYAHHDQWPRLAKAALVYCS